MTAEMQDAPPGPYGPLPGVLVIEWPAAPPESPHLVPCGLGLNLYQLDLDGAEQPLPGVVHLTLSAGVGVGDPVTADVETLTGADGRPFLGGGGPVSDATAVFRYAVAAVRLRAR